MPFTKCGSCEENDVSIKEENIFFFMMVDFVKIEEDRGKEWFK